MRTGWMLPDEVMDWIHDNLPDNSVILEFGSGEGTVELSSRYEMISVEHDENWLARSKGTYIHANIVDNPISTKFNQKGWYDSRKLTNLPSFVDAIIIDGPPGDIGRIGILAHLELLPAFSYCIIDDTDREAEFSLLEELTSALEFEDQIEITSASQRDNGIPRKATVLVRS